jgi:hypothetical protein
LRGEWLPKDSNPVAWIDDRQNWVQLTEIKPREIPLTAQDFYNRLAKPVRQLASIPVIESLDDFQRVSTDHKRSLSGNKSERRLM